MNTTSVINSIREIAVDAARDGRRSEMSIALGRILNLTITAGWRHPNAQNDDAPDAAAPTAERQLITLLRFAADQLEVLENETSNRLDIAGAIAAMVQTAAEDAHVLARAEVRAMVASELAGGD